MALTLDKVKAKELRSQSKNGDNKHNGNDDNLRGLDSYLPSQEQLDELKNKYKTFLKASSDK
jgi:hypothetical protein